MYKFSQLHSPSTTSSSADETADKLPESNVYVMRCCFTSTETVGLLGTGALDGHLGFHTAPEH